MANWVLIDDSPEEAASFSTRLSHPNNIRVEHMGAQDALDLIGTGEFNPAGVLMDVDLSNETGHAQTGPGMSQNMRIAQVKRTIPAFPIVRFSLREKVLENIGRDNSSDDIFDLKIEKDGLSDDSVLTHVQSMLLGVEEIYHLLNASTDLQNILSVSEEIWSRWGSSALQSDFEIGDRVHLKAAPIVRIMVHPGVLIDESILSFRLGIDSKTSIGWPALKDSLSGFAYKGASSDHFVRWWGRGLEEWWQDGLGIEVPLAGLNIQQRMEILSQHFADLVPLKMPKGSMGDRPWRYCLLTKEQRQEIIPVDPSKAVKIIPRRPMPTWLDPLYAALGVALKNPTDLRLDKGDLKRLQALARKL